MEGKLSLENFNQFDKMFDENIKKHTKRMLELEESSFEFEDSKVMNDFIDYWKSELENLYYIPNSNFKSRKEVVDKYIHRLEIKRLNDKDYEINCIFNYKLNLMTLDNNDSNFMTLKGNNYYIKNIEL